jgi:hypothetical protein
MKRTFRSIGAGSKVDCNPRYSAYDLLACRGNEDRTDVRRTFVHERKLLPENRLRVCCPRLSVHVYGQEFVQKLHGRTLSGLRETSYTVDFRGSRFFCPVPVADKTAKGGVQYASDH